MRLCFRAQPDILANLYTDLRLFLSEYLHFYILPLFPTICGFPALCHLVLLVRNCEFLLALTSCMQYAISFFSVSDLLNFWLHFSHSPVPSGFFYFCLKFIVVICKSVGLTEAYLAILENKIYLCCFNWKYSMHKSYFMWMLIASITYSVLHPSGLKLFLPHACSMSLVFILCTTGRLSFLVYSCGHVIS